MLVDTHCHLDFPEFKADVDEIIASCHAEDINYFLVPSVKKENFESVISLSKKFPSIIPALGLHPYFIKEHKLNDIEILEKTCENNQILAIGETGLDFYLDELITKELKAKQLQFFEAQVQLAQQYQYPLIIHARKSHEDILKILKRIKPSKGGFIHSFNGSLEQAKEYIKLDYKFGFGGAMTYPKATKIRSLAKTLPLESLVLETDSPDMLPSFSREKRNTPENIRQIFNVLVGLRSETASEIEEQLTINCQELFQVII